MKKESNGTFLYKWIGMLICLCPLSALAQQIEAEPIAIQLMENGILAEGEPATYGAGDLIEGSAPLELEFKANVTNPSPAYRYEWGSFSNIEAGSTPITRFEENTVYRFEQSGTYHVKLIVSEPDAPGTPYNSDIFVIKISESSLKVPNAFSPNGDGVNDRFKVTYKSLVRFNAYVFNRWGQQLYQWGLGNIDDGWDGTHHGKSVKDGVYFIVVEAQGSDGRKYTHKGDITILRGGEGYGNPLPTP